MTTALATIDRTTLTDKQLKRLIAQDDKHMIIDTGVTIFTSAADLLKTLFKSVFEACANNDYAMKIALIVVINQLVYARLLNKAVGATLMAILSADLGISILNPFD